MLDILFTCGFDHSGGTDRAVAFRLRLDGTLIATSRAATDNNLGASNMNVAIRRRVAVAAGAHTVAVEWTKFGAPAGLIRCRPVTLPDQQGAQLRLEEHRT